MSGHDVPSFFTIWTTPPHTFLSRFMRSIDSVFKHHPSATVSVLSNTLPTGFFNVFARTGFDARIVRYDLRALTSGTRAEVWVDFRRFWNRSAYFANHEADLLRLLWLRRHGGVYFDTDIVFVRPLQLGACDGAFGIESGGGGDPAPHVGAPASSPAPLPARAVLCNAVMAFRSPASSLLDELLREFVGGYVPYPPGLSMLQLHAIGAWGAMGPLLLTRTVSRRTDPRECVWEREALYAVPPERAGAHFGPWDDARDGALWEVIAARAVAVHYWNALTRALPLRCGSLVHRLLEANCAVCAPALVCD